MNKIFKITAESKDIYCILKIKILLLSCGIEKKTLCACKTFKKMASNCDFNQMNQVMERIEMLSHRVEQLERNTMKRIVKKLLAPPALNKIQLHEQTMQHCVDLFNYLPANEDVKAVLVSALVAHGNHPNGHAYLGFDAYQQRCPVEQKTSFIEQTYNCHGTLHKQELIVSWNNRENNQSMNLIIDITSSYNTGSYTDQGNTNYFQIQITGYIV